jgi:hypothetical protein
MPQTFIVKFIPHTGTLGVLGRGCVIHRIPMPTFADKGHYRETGKWNGFAHGKRKGASRAEKESRRDGCVWAPTGLYYCHDLFENQWNNKCDFAREYQVEMGRPDRQDEVDERNWPSVTHADLDAFLTHIGFDRKTRRYI